MKSEDLVNLIFSPVWISTLLHHFLSGAQHHSQQGIKSELLYLAMPFVIEDVTRNQLISANITSTFSSVFQKNNKDKSENDILNVKNSLIQKNTLVKEYREATNRGLIYLGNVERLEIRKFITVDNVADYKREQGVRREFCKAAFYFGVILAKEDYRNILVKLGITNI